MASSRRSTRSVRHSFASSAAARGTEPWWSRSLASNRSNRLKASAAAPALPPRRGGGRGGGARVAPLLAPDPPKRAEGARPPPGTPAPPLPAVHLPVFLGVFFQAGVAGGPRAAPADGGPGRGADGED